MYVKKNLMFWAAVLALALPLVLAGSALATGIDGGYVGTNAGDVAGVLGKACLDCHNGATASDKTSVNKAGHPYKVRTTMGKTPVAGATTSTDIHDPLSAIQLNNTPLCTAIDTLTLGDAACVSTPTSTNYFKDNGSGRLSWDAVQYVVGGFHGKIRWALKDLVNSCSNPTAAYGECKTGYIVTGSATQFNMKTAQAGDPLSDWSAYNSNQDKQYDCAICHNTNGIARGNSWNDVISGGSGTLGYRTQPWLGMGWTIADPLTFTNNKAWKSEWTLDGVQCEACHGKGSNGTDSGHADSVGSQNVLAIVSSEQTALNTVSIPATAGSYTAALAGNIEICAKCHIRGSNASGGKEWGASSLNRSLRNGAEMQGNVSAENRAFIKHHEQYNEMVGINTSLTDTNPANGDGVHRSLNCTSCHNPHQRAAQVADSVAAAMNITDNNQSAQQRGAVVSCANCHGAKTVRLAMGSTNCVDCHMGEATRSAPSAGMMGTWGRQADVKTHIFKVSTTATDIVRSANTVTDGAGSLIPVAIAKNALTVDYACGKCHDSSLGINADGSKGLGAGVTTAMSRVQAQFFAAGIHTGGTFSMSTLNHPSSAGTPGSCVACHTDAGVAGGTVDVQATCGQCHIIGSAPALSLAQLTTVASTMHNWSNGTNAAPVVGKGTVTVGATGPYSVSFADASSDADGNNTATVTVNWGDGNISTGAVGSTFTHTYTRGKTYTIYHNVSDGMASASNGPDKFAATVPLKYSVSGTVTLSDGTTPVSGAYLSLKKNGHTVKSAKSNASGAYSFTNVVPGDYTIKVYKYQKTFASPAATVTVTSGNETVNISAQP